MINNCPDGFMCFCGCTQEELDELRINNLIELLSQYNAGLEETYSECMIDVYYGNGIRNDSREAYESMIALFGEFLNSGNFMAGKHHFGLAYNVGSEESFNDVIEAYWQLREAGQISDELNFYSTLYSVMNAFEADSFMTQGMRELKEYVDEQIPQIREELSENYSTMLTKYKNISFNNGHRVLLIAHSQGNLFGNYMYGMFDWQKEYFRMIGLASPASYVAGGGPHITVRWDPIRLIPNNLEWNVEGHWHSFLGTYLADKAGNKLNEHLVSLSKELDGISTQWTVVREENKENCNYRIELEHNHKSLSALPNKTGVYPFNLDDGKLYTVNSKLVFAKCGGSEIRSFTCDTEKPELCYALQDTEDTIEVTQKDLNVRRGFEVSLNGSAYTQYDHDTAVTIAHNPYIDFPYWNYHFDVKYDQNATGSWTASRHATNQWTNECGDVLRIGNGANQYSWIHRGINLCVEINDGQTLCYDIQ